MSLCHSQIDFAFIVVIVASMATGVAAKDFRKIRSRVASALEKLKKIGSRDPFFDDIDIDLSLSINFSIVTRKPIASSLGRPTPSFDFSNFSAGEIVQDLGKGVNVQAWKYTKTGAVDDGQAMIFDSSNPTGGDKELGSPNQSFGGPGIGQAGQRGKLFANKMAQNNVLIVSENGKETDPDDNAMGGFLHFTFTPPRYVDSISLLNNVDGAIIYVMSSHASGFESEESIFVDENGGKNSFVTTAIGKPSVKVLEVYFEGSGAVTDIAFQKSSCSKFNSYDFRDEIAGDAVKAVGKAVIVAADKNDNVIDATVIDTSSPGHGNGSYGTPHNSFGGPGVGYAGKKGTPFSNREKQGRAIVAMNSKSSDKIPEKIPDGGSIKFSFKSPQYIESIGLLNSSKGAVLTIHTMDGGMGQIQTMDGGDNSFELVKISKPGVTKVVVQFLGSGAITEIVTCS